MPFVYLQAEKLMQTILPIWHQWHSAKEKKRLPAGKLLSQIFQIQWLHKTPHGLL